LPGGRLQQINDRDLFRGTESGLQVHRFFILSEKFGVIFVKLFENSGNNRLSAKFCLRFDFILLAIKLYSFQFLVVEKNGLSVLSYGFFLYNILHFFFKNDL